MQPLDHQLWEKQFAQIRPRILAEWPQIDQPVLEHVQGDWAALLELVQRTTGMSADVAADRLRRLEIPELGIGTGGSGERDAGEQGQASLQQLRLAGGFSESDRERVVARLSKLNRMLRRFPAEGTELVLTVKDRDQQSQKISLECRAPRYAAFVATSSLPDLHAALADVRDDLWSQIDTAVGRRKEGSR